MDKHKLKQLIIEIEAELKHAQELNTLILEAKERSTDHQPKVFELYAIGGILHDLYNFVEGICYRIIKTIDRVNPTGASWHQELLDQASQAVPQLRPAIVSPEMQHLLDPYRTFRHRFRNIYGFKLDREKMKPLLQQAQPTLESFVKDIELFLNFLRMISQG